MKVAIVGGGASGVTAALTCAAYGTETVLLEKNDRILKKLLLTGNGRCNITHDPVDVVDYHFSEDDREALISILDRFDLEKEEEFFDELSLPVITEDNGCTYPATRSAASVVNVFRRELKRKNVNVLTDWPVRNVERMQTGGYVLKCDKGDIECDRIILSCGGCSYPKTGSDGSGFKLLEALHISFVKPYPSLTALCGYAHDKKAFSMLSGLREFGDLYDKNGDMISSGQIQFTDYGISGIAVFDISERYVRQAENELFFSIRGYETKDRVLNAVDTVFERYGNLSFEEAFAGLFHKKWIDFYSKALGLKDHMTVSDIPKNVIDELCDMIVRLPVKITGYKGFDFCQVTGGGVSLSDLDDDLRFKDEIGIYITGEMIDVTGKCGGYNLHFANATGYIAGKAAAL